MSSWLLWKGYFQISTWRLWKATVFQGLRNWISVHIYVLTFVKLKRLGRFHRGMAVAVKNKVPVFCSLTHTVFSRGASRIPLRVHCLEGTEICLKCMIPRAPPLQQTTQTHRSEKAWISQVCVTPSPHSHLNHYTISQSLCCGGEKSCIRSHTLVWTQT